MTPETSFVLIFSAATAVAIAARRLRIPYTVALVVVGLVLGTLSIVEAPHLTQRLLFAVILPGLLFEASFNLDMREFWQNRRAIGVLAVPGVVAAIGLTAAIVTPVLRGLGLDPTFTWGDGLVFGALIAATDPIAVVALFRALNVGHRMTTLIEGESLLNDGTSVVLFTLILAYVGGASTSAASLGTQFVAIVGGGAVIGVLVGFVATQVTRLVDEPLIEITLTVIAAYGSFAVAEQLHFSGVIATVATGMVCGTLGWHTAMSPSTQLAVESFWDYVAFALNSIVFMLIGFELRPGMLLGAAALVAVAYLGTLVARLCVVSTTATLLRPTAERLPPRWIAVLTWGGLRGALSMVLALALPADFPHREQLITMTFGVVLLTLLLQGTTMAPLLRALGLVGEQAVANEFDQARLELRISDGAMRELDAMGRQHLAAPRVLEGIRERVDSRRHAAQERLAALHLADDTLRRDEAIRAVRRLLVVERRDWREAAQEGRLSAAVVEAMTADVDARLARLESGSVEDVYALLSPGAAVPPPRG